MRNLIAGLMLAMMATVVTAEQIRFSWNPSPDSVSPSGEAFVTGGYNLYWGAVDGTFTDRMDIGLNTSTVVDVPTGSEVFYALTTYTTTSIESGFSQSIRFPLDPTGQPSPPTGIRARTERNVTEHQVFELSW
ncbi:MAG: hypothetical protein M3H12_18785 [Chromatiales bacterium]|nr:hypothetical protein [Gammaproteobacteria bacterium]